MYDRMLLSTPPGNVESGSSTAGCHHAEKINAANVTRQRGEGDSSKRAEATMASPAPRRNASAASVRGNVQARASAKRNAATERPADK